MIRTCPVCKKIKIIPPYRDTGRVYRSCPEHKIVVGDDLRMDDLIFTKYNDALARSIKGGPSAISHRVL